MCRLVGMAKKDPYKVRKIPASIVNAQRKTMLIEGLSTYLDERTLATLTKHISEAIPLAGKIVEDRNISASVIAEDAGFYHDPFIIPTTLAEYTQAGPSSIIAALLFASLRPVRGGDPNLHEPSMRVVQEFVDGLAQQHEYDDVLDIILGALRMRALEPPQPLRPILTVKDLLAEPSVEETKNNQRRLAMIMIAANDNRAITLRLTQQLVRLQQRTETLADIKDVREREALLKELYYMRHSYIPLADRLGQRKLVEAMQDQVLRLADPVMHQKLHQYIGVYTDRFEGAVDASDKVALIDKLCQLISSKLPGIEGLEVYGRVKSPYSLWLKMHEKGATLETLEKVIFDYIGVTARFDFPGAEDMTNQECRGKAQQDGIEIFEKLRHQRRLFTIVPQKEKISEDNVDAGKDSAPALSHKSRKRKAKIDKAKGEAADNKQDSVPVMVDMRNYMEDPKANGYRAIHVLLQVNVAKGVAPLIDFHIVWKEDDRNNTYGNASHAHFKSMVEASPAAKAVQQWRIAANEIYVQVGDGRIRRFQQGASIADVAERIHTGMLAIASGARVTRSDPADAITDMNRPLHVEVKNGDRVVVLLHGTEHAESLVRNEGRRRYVLKCLRGPIAVRNMKVFYRRIDKSAGLDN